jgi:ATP-dependent exoDNAse (exonuclease V) alpha subunit
VVLALAQEHHVMLTRELLYTGLTRAASAAVGVWSPGALSLALQRRSGHRHTRLAELVRDR